MLGGFVNPTQNKPIQMTTYKQSLIELQQIVSDLENETIGVDELSEKVKRASELIQFCQQKLRGTEATVNQTLGLEENREE